MSGSLFLVPCLGIFFFCSFALSDFNMVFVLFYFCFVEERRVLLNRMRLHFCSGTFFN